MIGRNYDKTTSRCMCKSLKSLRKIIVDLRKDALKRKMEFTIQTAMQCCKTKLNYWKNKTKPTNQPNRCLLLTNQTKLTNQPNRYLLSILIGSTMVLIPMLLQINNLKRLTNPNNLTRLMTNLENVKETSNPSNPFVNPID